MTRPIQAALAFTGMLLACLSAAIGQTAEQREGTHEGADFVISMPPAWNGGLVMFAHGYEGEMPGRGNVVPSPMAAHLTAGGIA